MILYKVRRKIVKFFINNYNFYKIIIFRERRIKEKDKVLNIEVTHLHLNRYLYVFLKFFGLNGYTIYLPRERKILNEMTTSQGEISWLLKEEFIRFGYSKKKDAITLKAENLSNDYFTLLLQKNISPLDYYVPMCEYPTWYQENRQMFQFSANSKRKRSIFMAGNINERLYNRISEEKIFQISSRLQVASFLKNQAYWLGVNSFVEIQDFIAGNGDNKVIVVDTSERKIWIQGDLLKETIANFDFFLGLPGIEIPQSHNLIEAMSVGAIPVLEKTYAELFCPVLKHNENAIVFENIDDLNSKVNLAFSLSEKQVTKLRKNVINYYGSYLTPKAVVKRIEEQKINKIFLQAEVRSLDILRKKLSVND